MKPTPAMQEFERHIVRSARQVLDRRIAGMCCGDMSIKDDGDAVRISRPALRALLRKIESKE
jgi:hypothetical protein